MLAVLVALAGMIGGAMPALAADGDPEYLTVDKRVNAETISVDEPFTYTIVVNCSEATCLEAHLQDVFPAELDGYRLRNLTITPSASAVPRDVTWTVDGAAAEQPDVLTADTMLDVDFQQPGSDPEGLGLESGTRVTISVTLQAPTEKTPGSYEFTNTATTEATNSAADESSATTTLQVPSVLDVDVSKAWAPEAATYAAGATSQISLGVTNTSNGPVETLTIEEPQTAADGAAALDASNPFTITDLTAFNATMPAGAESAQVDVYLQYADGSYGWETGTPQGAPALPVGVDPGAVAGIRITYTGTAIERQASSAVTLDLALRETHRDTDADLSTESHTVDNVTTSSAAVPGRDPVIDTAEASYTVTPPNLGVETSKTITPDRIAAGDTASATVTGTNGSDVAVAELRVADLDYFTADITFGGFTAAPTWPETASGAVVLYHPLDGSEPVSVPFTEGQTPAAPSSDISGFEIVFTSETGIVSGSGTSAEFTIETAESAVATGETLPTTNTVETTVTSFNDRTAAATDDADLTLVAPAVDVTLTKTIRPGATIRPGEDAVTQLSSNLTTTSDYVVANEIVVEDAATGDGGFWDGFNLTSVAPTQVPGDASLTIAVQLPDGSWAEVANFPAQSGPFLASLSNAELAAALPDGVSTDQLTGIRFTFTNETEAGFASDTTVTPYVVSTARDELRSGEPVGTDPVSYDNLATTTGTGHTAPGTPLTDDDSDVDTAIVAGTDGTGPGPGVGIDKRWNQATIPALSDQQASTTLSWRVSRGYEEVVISDPADPVPTDVADTVFDAFDLVQVNPVGADDEPYSNGWFLRYDTVTAVELYDGTDWTVVPEPADGWQANGAFVGYTLSGTERASALGVRVLLEENTAAREAADVDGDSYDPYAPAPGTGVATSSASRSFDLTWQLRDTTRSNDSWVTDEATYNTSDPGMVDNTTSVTGTPIDGGDPVTDTDHAVITIAAYPPGVKVTKTVDPSTELYVPMAGADPDAYPSAAFTLTANNNSITPASYLRVTDPAGCTDAEDVSVCQTEGTADGATGDPFATGHTWISDESLFDRFNLTGIDIAASIPVQVDLAGSIVWLLHDDGTTSSTDAAAANALSAADLADVIAVSVTFTGPTLATITADNKLTVELATQLRPTLRLSGADQVLSANDREQIPNRVFAQSYDPILNDDVLTGAGAEANALLTGGDINVGPTKSVSPAALTEPTRNDPVTVTVGANQGTDPVSTLAPAEVRLTDDVTTSPDFWNTFDLTGLGEVTAPAGADQVQTWVYGPYGDAGALAWADGPVTATDAAALPDVDLAQAQGIRFAFSRADGEFFSDQVPAPAWSTTAAFTVQLRATYRDSGEPVLLDGEITNTVTVISDRLNGESSEAKATAAVIGLSEGTFELEVDKLANDGNHFASAGDLVPWDLTLRNSGTGYLDLTEVRDALPAHLVYLGDEAEYTADEDGLLSEDVTLSEDGADLVFTWPEGENRMTPGRLSQSACCWSCSPD